MSIIGPSLAFSVEHGWLVLHCSTWLRRCRCLEGSVLPGEEFPVCASFPPLWTWACVQNKRDLVQL